MAERIIMFAGLMLMVVIGAPMHNVHAQIRTDGTVGAAAQTLSGPDYQIGAALAAQSGSNLFHSFSAFNIHSGESAVFNGPAGIQNIFSRVTGGAASTINGTLGSSIADASLYLLNPAGIVFGPEATLDIPGAFYVSTADHISFADGKHFESLPISGEVLSTAPPAAFGFVNAAPTAIVVNQSSLVAESGQFVSLVGGEIVLDGGSITAQGGAVVFSGPDTSGLVPVAVASDDNDDAGSSVYTGTVTLRNGAGIEVGAGTIDVRSGTILLDASTISARATGTADGGNISIRSGAITIDGSNGTAGVTADTVGENGGGAAGDVIINSSSLHIFLNGRISSSTFGDGNAGNVVLTTDTLVLVGESEGGTTGIFSDSHQTMNGGNGGKIRIDARLIDVAGGMISTSTFGAGNGGAIDIMAETITVRGGNSTTGIAAVAFAPEGSGRSGTITITTNTLEVMKNGGITTNVFGDGDGGDIEVYSDILIIDGENLFAGIGAASGHPENGGSAGNILIDTTELHLLNGGMMTSTTVGPGDGGDITVTASKIVMEGSGTPGHVIIEGFLVPVGFTGLLAQTLSDGESAGSGGRISIDTDMLTINAHGIINVGTQGPGQGGGITIDAATILIDGQGMSDETGIFATTTDAIRGGNAGPIVLTTGTLNIANGGIVTTSTFGTGAGGAITIHAAATTIDGHGMLTGLAAAGFGTVNGGRSGDIRINSDTVVIHHGGAISTNVFGDGEGGDIVVTAGEITIDGNTMFAGIAAASVPTAAGGNSGNVAINADSLELIDGGIIVATTRGEGNGGNVAVTADEVTIGGTAVANEIVVGGFVTPVGFTGILADSRSPAVGGDGGTISIDAGSLRLLADGVITTSTNGFGSGGNINITAEIVFLSGARDAVAATEIERLTGIQAASLSQNEHSGEAGDVTIDADGIVLVDNARINTSSAGGARAGRIVIRGDDLRLDNGAEIASTSTGDFSSGNAGTIAVDMVHDVVISHGSLVTTESRHSGGGNIVVNAGNIIYLLRSELSTSVLASTGDGGNVTIDPIHVVLNNSRIIANAVAGNGGNISITTEHFIQSANSVVQASSETGVAGNIQITSPDSEFTGDIVTLASSFLNAETMVAARCAARLGSDVATLVVGGSGGVPVSPDDMHTNMFDFSRRDRRPAPPDSGMVDDVDRHIEDAVIGPPNDCEFCD